MSEIMLGFCVQSEEETGASAYMVKMFVTSSMVPPVKISLW